MGGRAITFDFHNTLVHCDAWFELEVRTLPSAFLCWLGTSVGDRVVADDGILFDNAYRRLRNAILRHGHELTAEESLKLVLANSGFSLSDKLIERGVAELMTEALDHACPVDGAVETVLSLSDAGISLGIVSSAVYDPFLHWALRRFDIHRHFGTIVTSASSGYYKSRPEIYWDALNALSASPGQSAHVGDSARFDVDTAARAGMRTAFLDYQLASRPVESPWLILPSLVDSAPALIELLNHDAR